MIDFASATGTRKRIRKAKAIMRSMRYAPQQFQFD
jgi:hypothetical protein